MVDLEELKQELKLSDTKISKKIADLEAIPKYSIKFSIPGEPRETKRPRTAKYGHMYVPDAAKNKKYIRSYIPTKIIKEVIKGPIDLYINFYVSIPKAFSKLDVYLAEAKYILPTVTPDVDNLCKTYMDAFTKIIWLDDGQVTNIHAHVYYSKEPRTVVYITYKQDTGCSILNKYAKDKLLTYELSK